MAVLVAGTGLVFLAGCAEDAPPGTDQEMGSPPPPPAPDLTLLGGEDASLPENDAALPVNECGDHEPTCSSQTFAAPFPLRSDPMPEGGEEDQGVKRDANGNVALDPAARVWSEFLWIGNSDLTTSGTVSKYSTKRVREVARYRSVTCFSLKTGGNWLCDPWGNGCCSNDDWPRYQARVNKMNEPRRQQVEMNNNFPARTALDFNGDLLVANQAFGNQSSVTKIAANLSDCVDHDRNGRIDTSSDTNGDGFIQVDCNGDGYADTIDSVKRKPCSNGLPQEYYDLDDDCILWTTNTYSINRSGRGIATVPRKGGGMDVWAGGGGFNTQAFAGLDGTTGMIFADTTLAQGCIQFSAQGDDRGIVWVGSLGPGKLCYFDSASPASVGAVRDPQWGPASGHGITIDRDQNVWIGETVARYTPDRSNGFNNLGSGWWARMNNLSGRGIAADSRSANAYYVWSCVNNVVVQIPASTLPVMKADQIIMNPGWPTISMPCSGAGVDSDQNVWGANDMMVTRARVDKAGSITQPTVNGQPMGMNVCPAGDSCKAIGTNEVIGEFTGFNPARTSGPLTGRYARTIVRKDSCGVGKQTRWLRLSWDADVPAGTRIDVRYRSGDTPIADITWTGWMPAAANPEMLMADHPYLQVEFTISAPMAGVTPILKSFTVLSECTG